MIIPTVQMGDIIGILVISPLNLKTTRDQLRFS